MYVRDPLKKTLSKPYITLSTCKHTMSVPDLRGCHGTLKNISV